MWGEKTVSVVLMTFAERSSIRKVITSFLDTGFVDEVVVVNNNAEAGTSEEVESTGVRHVMEHRQGYGFATRRGLAEATGDIVILCEPDGTFDAYDIVKLLAYSDDCNVVFGTRTHRQMIHDGANMGWLLRTGNILVAKLMMVLFGSPHLSDVGCTYRLLDRSTVDRVLPRLQVGGSQLGPELMMHAVLSGARYVEIPVNYLPRVGTSSVTGNMTSAVLLGLQMVALILATRLRSMRNVWPPAQTPGLPTHQSPSPGPASHATSQATQDILVRRVG